MATYSLITDLTPPLRDLLEKGWLGDPEKELVHVAAFEDETPVGIAAAVLDSKHPLAELKSLKGNSQEIEKKLLDKLAEVVKEKRCLLLFATYPVTAPIAPLLRSCQWEGPKLVKREYHYDSQKFQPNWLLKPYKLPQNFTIFPWDKLKKKEREELIAERNPKLIPDYLHPFNEKSFFQPSNSLGLRHQGKVIGWCLTESTSPGTLHYSKLYIAPPFRLNGSSIILLVESLRRHNHSVFPQAFLTVDLEKISVRWLRFVKKRLLPLAQGETDVIQMWRNL